MRVFFSKARFLVKLVDRFSVKNGRILLGDKRLRRASKILSFFLKAPKVHF